jgi:hypothetical protein
MADGLRPITVEGTRYRWRFNGRLVVIPRDRSSPQLTVDWGWQDWLEPGVQSKDPLVVTPSFVDAAIRFAIANGWKPETNGAPFQLGFEAGSFCLASQRS